MLWHEQSWPKLDKMDRQTPVIVPVASCEQHGRHLPVFVDSLQVTHIAEHAEKRMSSEVLLTPTLWLGSSHHHLDFPGTISVTPTLFSEMIKQIAQSIMRAGFKRIVFLNGHGGNHVPVSQALGELVCASDDADGRHFALATWWILAAEQLKGIVEPQGFVTPNLSHACEWETSTTLHMRPELVDLAAAVEYEPVLQNDWFDTAFERKACVTLFNRFHRWTKAGNLGSPRSATAVKGKAILDTATEQLVRFVRDMRKWPDRPPLK